MLKHLKEMRGGGGKKGWEAWQKCRILHLNKCLESWGRWGLASIPAVSLGLVARLTWMDGGAWPGSISLQGSEDMDISPSGLQGESQIT